MHTVKNSLIDGIKIDDFLEIFEDEAIYLLDIDSYNRHEMNLKVYDELAGLAELWIDAAPRRHYDVMDILITGGNLVVIHENFMNWREINRAIELTENLALKSYSIENIEKFVTLGGNIIITSSKIAEYINVKSYIIRGGEICLWKN